MSASVTENFIPNKLFFKIGDVSGLVGVKPYVLRYWETEFKLVTPLKSKAGQRVYQRKDVESLLLIKHLLYRERYSIEGAKKRLLELKRHGELLQAKKAVVLAPGSSLAGPLVDSASLRKERLKELQRQSLDLLTEIENTTSTAFNLNC